MTSSTLSSAAGSTRGGRDTATSPRTCGSVDDALVLGVNGATRGVVPAGQVHASDVTWDTARVRPLIGITSYVEQARWGVWDTTAALVPYSYVQQVEAAGGTVVLVPPNATDAPEVLAVLDGLLLAGGADLDPALYGADAARADRRAAT